MIIIISWVDVGALSLRLRLIKAPGISSPFGIFHLDPGYTPSLLLASLLG